MDALLEALGRWRGFTTVVVGDFMLDQFVHGRAERLSPDAPVPILHVSSVDSRAGGSANVCLDLVALGSEVHAVGVIGDDAHGRALRSALERELVRTGSLMVDGSRPTTTKQNLIGLAQGRHPQKMFRLDFESREAVPAGVASGLVRIVEGLAATADCICIEDYNKGVCTPEVCRGVIAAGRRAGKPVYVDPARIVDYSKYKGATAITPNRTEAEEATGLTTDDGSSPEHNARVAASLVEALELEACVLTLDKQGALLLERGGVADTIPTVARTVYDVTGAGDMFLAAMAAARCQGLGWHDSVRLANAAAGLEVEVFGCQPIPLDRIHYELLTRASGGRGSYAR